MEKEKQKQQQVFIFILTFFLVVRQNIWLGLLWSPALTDGKNTRHLFY